jgi:hypothetical protein
MRAQYGQDNTWGLTYNLWADKALGLNIFPASVYQMQAAWYKKQLRTSFAYTERKRALC